MRIALVLLFTLSVISCSTKKENKNPYGVRREKVSTEKPIIDSIGNRKSDEQAINNFFFPSYDSLVQSYNSLIYLDQPIEPHIETIVIEDSVLDFRINPTNHQILRVIHRNNSKVIMIDSLVLKYPSEQGWLGDFLNNFVVFNNYNGDGYGGDIIKSVYELSNNELKHLIEIDAGYYGEGAGATNRIITYDGSPLGGVIDLEHKYNWNYKHLLILNQPIENLRKILKIDSYSKDTIIFTAKLKDVRRLGSSKYLTVFVDGEILRQDKICVFDNDGEAISSIKTNHIIDDFLIRANESQLIASAYIFTGKPKKNSVIKSIRSFDLNTEQKKWDIPLAKLYDSSSVDLITKNLKVISLFNISPDLWGMIISKLIYSPDTNIHSRSNKLVILDDTGQIAFKIDLLANTDQFIIDSIDESQF